MRRPQGFYGFGSGSEHSDLAAGFKSQHYLAARKTSWRNDKPSGKLLIPLCSWQRQCVFPGAQHQRSVVQHEFPTFLHRGVK